MGRSGLKEQWGLQDAKPGTSSPQSNMFKADFEATMTAVKAALPYTAQHSERSKHAAVAGKATKAYSLYQAIQKKIAASPSASEGPAGKVLTFVARLKGEAEALKGDTEAALAAWKARTGTYAAAGDQIDELEASGAPGAAGLLADLRAVDEAAAQHSWTAARTSLEALVGDLAAAFKAYLRQRAAEADYAAERQKFDRAYGDANSHPTPSAAMVRIADQIDTQLPAIGAHATAGNYAEALEQLRMLGGPLRELQEAKGSHEQREADYASGLAALQPDLSEASVSEFEVLLPMQEEMAALQTSMAEAAGTGNFEQALAHLTDLETKARDYLTALEEEREKQRRREAFETRAGEIETRMPIESSLAELQDAERDLIAGMAQARSLAGHDDFDGAETQLDALEQKLEAYNIQRDAPLEEEKRLKAERERFAKAFAPVNARVEECMLGALAFTKLKSDRDAVQETLWAAEEAAVEKADFELADKKLAEAKTKADAYLKKAQAEQAQYDKKGEGIIKQLEENELGDNKLAQKIVGKFRKDDLKHLPTNARNALMEALQEEETAKDEKAMRKLLSEPYLDPVFEKIDKANREKFIKALEDDAALEGMSENWSTMSESERLKALQKVVDIQAKAYGVSGSKIEPIEEKSNLRGQYSHGDNKIEVNTQGEEGAFDVFELAMETAAHEMAHRCQQLLADRVDSGKSDQLKKGDPLYDQAKAFDLNRGGSGYAVSPSEDFGVYETQPKEHHSQETSWAAFDADI